MLQIKVRLPQKHPQAPSRGADRRWPLRWRGGLIVALVLAFTLSPAAVRAEGDDAKKVRQEQVGGANITLPVLPGFEEVLGRSAAFDQMLAGFIQPDHRMLALYIASQDVTNMQKTQSESFDRYILVQAMKQGGYLDGDIGFEDVKRSFKQEMSALRPLDTPEVEQVMREATAYIGSTYDAEMKMEIGESYSKGVFAENENYIGFLTVSRVAIETPQGKRDYPSAVATVATNIRGRLVFIYAYHNNYQRLSDVDDVRDVAQDYADKLLAANPQNLLEIGTGRKVIVAVLLLFAVVAGGALVIKRVSAADL